jgi:hypothetical protein
MKKLTPVKAKFLPIDKNTPFFLEDMFEIY